MKKAKRSIGRRQYWAAGLALALMTAACLGAVLYVQTRPKSLPALFVAIQKDTVANFAQWKVEDDAWLAQSALTVPVRAPGYDFAVASSAFPTLSFYSTGGPETKTVRHLFFFRRTVTAPKDFDSVSLRVVHVLTTNGFMYHSTEATIVSYRMNGLLESAKTYTTVYTRGTTTCLLSESPLQATRDIVNEDASAGAPQLSCYDAITLRATASLMEPLVDSYLKAHVGQQATDIILGPLIVKSKNGSGVISASKTPGYDIAEGLITAKGVKTLVVYYEKDNAWHFVTTADDEFGFQCGPMQASPDARRAFYDQICLGQHGQVRLDTNNRALQ